MNEVGSLMERADRYLASARLLLSDGDNESCVSRAYYAMFYAAEAALLREGITVSSHRAAITQFGDRFVTKGTFPREMGRDLRRAFDKRQLGDYTHKFVITADEAAEIVRTAEAFVHRVAEHLKE